MKLHYLSIAMILILSLSSATLSYSSNIIEVLPLTNKIIMVHFDDGSVAYPNNLVVDRLNVVNVEKSDSWSFSSTDDTDFSTAINPKTIGRKSKGTEFVKDAPWGAGSFDPTGKPWASEHWIYLIFDKALKTGKQYSLNSGTLAKNGSTWNFVFEEKNLRSEAIHVNTIGYETNAPKYGYIYQWMGSIGGMDLSSYAGKKFWIYKGEEIVKEGDIKKRKSATNAETGQTNDTPNKNFLGSEVYECDFSAITADGTYKLVVEGIGSSYPFRIGKDAVWEAYYNVARALYYQRSGIRLAPPYTIEGYIRPVNQNTKVTSDDGTSYAGKLFYSDYSYMDWAEADGGGSSKAAIRTAAEGKPLDVAGWYHDAGDWDSYYSHHRIPILLMLTWEYAPERFGDNELNIPESGNGIPDLIDEASWLIKFNYRLRKELITRGYSDGGVGGARICADVYTDVDGNSESTLPSWKEKRRTMVTKADAFMTYFYAGQAAQFACILKKVGKDPTNFLVEMLDDVDIENMSKDTVNWIKEAEEAYQWASAPANQPASSKNYASSIGTYKMYAAANLFRLTGKEEYHSDALAQLTKLKTNSSLSEDDRWGVYSYLLSNNSKRDINLQANLKKVAVTIADNFGINSAKNRACRWGGNFDFPMLVGQATTPMIFETILAACITGDKKYEDVVHSTADYFLGNNPLHSSWMTGVGPRPATAGFHLDSRYNNNWVNYPGFIPYGPWSMAYGFEPYTYTIDGVSIKGGHGSWNKDWANYSMYPLMDNWPGHERWNGNIHAPMSTENTVHQNTVFGALTYGFVNNRHYENNKALLKIGAILLDKDTIQFSEPGEEDEIKATTDEQAPTFSALKWSSSEPRIAHVDAIGRVTGISKGECTITCSTLDGSVFKTCEVSCNWQEVSVDSIRFEHPSYSFFLKQSGELNLHFFPDSATNKMANFSAIPEGIVTIDENGLINAINTGITTVTATSLNGNKTTTCEITVNELVDYIIADFDSIIPVTTDPQDFISQLYTPDGTNDIAFDNPFVNAANPSAKVVEWGRPSGDWRLIGIVLPLKEPQFLGQFTQFQFKYYGKEIKDFFVQCIGKNGSIEFNQEAHGEDCWQLATFDLASSDSMVQFNVFVNKSGNPAAINCYFDDFMLSGTEAVRSASFVLSDSKIMMDIDDQAILTADTQGAPFTWVSSDVSVATVDQQGNVTAVGAGIAAIKAVPLYGDAAECMVTVIGDDTPNEYKEEVFLDFETITLDWSAGYGAYAWNSDKQGIESNPLANETNGSDKVFKWVRDITGNAPWGGYGIVLPVKNTKGWERISFQVYVNEPITSIRMELSLGETVMGEFTKTDLSIAANTWTTVFFDIAEMGMSNKTFDKIACQIAGGATVPLLTSYSDNFQFEKGILVSLPAISSSSSAISIYPNPVNDKLVISSSDGIKRVELYTISGQRIFQQNYHGEKSILVTCKFPAKNMLLVKGIGNDQKTWIRKVMTY